MRKVSLYEDFINEKREDVGKYNTVKKVIKELGRRPSEQELATFINNNYYDVTEVERGDDDPQANDKIADLVGFYKFDIEDWQIAWADAQNESVVTEAKRAGLSKKETLKVAQKFAAALTKLDGMKYTVSSDYEEDSFDLDVDGEEYAGGSYNINDDGSVVNMATWNRKTNVSPTYGNMDDDIKTIIKTIKNLKESVVTEARFNYKETGLSGQNLKDVKDGITGIKNALKRGNESAVISNYDLVQQRLQQYGGPKASEFLEKIKQLAGLDESTVTEGKIKYAKGTTYQSSGHWTVVVDSNSSGLDISVNHSAGWRLDPQDPREETFQLLDNGRQRATLMFKSGNIDKFAQNMFDLNDRTTYGNKTKLTAKDYADIIRVWIDMKMANESIVTEEDGRDTLAELNDMTLGQLERIEDYAEMIAERMEGGQQLESWMFSQITVSLDNLNAVHDAMDGEDGIEESNVNEAVSNATKIYQIATPAPKKMLVEELENLFGDDYRHIVTEFDDNEGYESVIMFNLSKSDIKKIEANIGDVLVWEYSIGKGKSII